MAFGTGNIDVEMMYLTSSLSRTDRALRWPGRISSASRSTVFPHTVLRACGFTPCKGSHPSDPVVSGSELLDHTMEPPACFVVASCRGLYEGYGHDRPVVCLGDDQTEAYLKDTGMTGLSSA